LDPYRHERVSESIREELDELIAYEMSDPRVGSATVTEVLISPDYRKAVIRLALIGTAAVHFEAALAADLAAKAAKILKRIERGRPKPGTGTEKNPVS
jgi:ribosome-binding factor A